MTYWCDAVHAPRIGQMVVFALPDSIRVFSFYSIAYMVFIAGGSVVPLWQYVAFVKTAKENLFSADIAVCGS
jgi:hypothetical protein